MGLAFFSVLACRDRPPVYVPKHTDGWPWSVGYELSRKWLASADFQRISCAVNFSIRTMAPPQCGHNQEAGNFVSPAWSAGRLGCEMTSSNRWQSGRSWVRRRFARNPTFSPETGRPDTGAGAADRACRAVGENGWRILG